MSTSPDGLHAAQTSSPDRAPVDDADARRFHPASAQRDHGGDGSETARTAFRNALMTWADEGGAR